MKSFWPHYWLSHNGKKKVSLIAFHFHIKFDFHAGCKILCHGLQSLLIILSKVYCMKVTLGASYVWLVTAHSSHFQYTWVYQLVNDYSTFHCWLFSCVTAQEAGNWSAYVSGLTVLTNKIYADLTRSHQVYGDLFQKYDNLFQSFLICCHNLKPKEMSYDLERFLGSLQKFSRKSFVIDKSVI